MAVSRQHSHFPVEMPNREETSSSLLGIEECFSGRGRGIAELRCISGVATTMCVILLAYLIETRHNPAENHLFDKSYKCFSYSAAVFAFSDYLTRQCSVECTSVGRSHEIFTVPLTQGQIV